MFVSNPQVLHCCALYVSIFLFEVGAYLAFGKSKEFSQSYRGTIAFPHTQKIAINIYAIGQVPPWMQPYTNCILVICQSLVLDSMLGLACDLKWGSRR